MEIRRSVPTRPLGPKAPATTPLPQAESPQPAMPGDRLSVQASGASASAVGDAAARARLALKESRDSAEATEGKEWRRIEEDPDDVNAPNWQSNVSPAALQKETELLKNCSEDQKKKYEKLAGLTSNDPAAREALIQLLADGKLKGKLLDRLDQLGRQDLANGLDRKSLVSDLIQEIQNPSAINQQNKGTCTVTVMQILLAKEDPSEYVRLVSGLATPDGAVNLANGKTIKREKDWADNSDEGEHVRTTSSRLFQPAMMEYANGGDDYDNTLDVNKKSWLFFSSMDQGDLSNKEVDRGLDGLFGKNYTSYSRRSDGVEHNRCSRDELYSALEKGLKAGQQVPVAMDWGDKDAFGNIHGGHQLLVTGVQDGRVYYDNPWGKKESMPLEDFKERVYLVSIRE